MLQMPHVGSCILGELEVSWYADFEAQVLWNQECGYLGYEVLENWDIRYQVLGAVGMWTLEVTELKVFGIR